MNIIFTKHAISRLHNRGITQSDAWYTFQHPDGSLPGKTPGSKKFYKNYGSQRIEVVAKQNKKGEWIILSCWAKQQGNNQPIVKKESPRPVLERIITFLPRQIWKYWSKPRHRLEPEQEKNHRTR